EKMDGLNVNLCFIVPLLLADEIISLLIIHMTWGRRNCLAASACSQTLQGRVHILTRDVCCSAERERFAVSYKIKSAVQRQTCYSHFPENSCQLQNQFEPQSQILSVPVFCERIPVAVLKQ